MATPLTDERTPLKLVKDEPAQAAPLAIEPRPRAAWILSGEKLRQRLVYIRDNASDAIRFHVTHSPYYLGWSLRGYRRLCLRWWEARQDDYRQQIATAKHMIREAKSQPRGSVRAADEAKARALRKVLRADYRAHKRQHWIKTGHSGLLPAAIVTGGAIAAGFWVQLLLALAFIVTGAYFGRPDEPTVTAPQAPTRTSHLGEETMRRVLVEGGAVPEKRGPEIRGVGIPHAEGPGIAYAVHTPSGIPAAVALAKKKEIASALGVHSDWLDLSVGNVETLLLIWVASEDPFAVVRSSPLLDHKGPVNTFRDGIPAAFAKRGNPITLRIRDTSILVAGATRRGKGMFLANVLIGVMKDPWVNVRIFDGKGTAEHNPYAPTLATFVKRNPERLAMISRAIVAELDRRSDLLDEHGYEKVEDEHYDEIMQLLGGREVFIVDELATYTPKGTSPYDEEITENLSQIAAVGAALGVLLISVTQVPEVSVIRGRLRQNHIGRAAMNTESGTASNTILGDGMTGQGYDASKIPIDQPGRFWLATPETGVIEGRSYLVTPDDKRRVAAEGYELRKAAGRLPGQWHDPIEEHLKRVTGVSSAAGGEGGKGRIVHFDFLTWLEDLALSTGRGNVTNLEVFTSLVDVSAEYARRDGETDEGWTARVGKLVRDLIATTGAELRVKRVPVDDGKRSQGYLLDDVTKALKSRK
ncbi:FtsK/SpoIIIE domain-containing protein [Streptomyces mirabilis]|uniref:FtsK/SpoIIIE domain-containing protein n=1 Tax=Streptomyces mirabilis TaxID=68239 RepID=UPI003317C60D